ncbi:MAG: nitroreductase [Agarilytica sp.]
MNNDTLNALLTRRSTVAKDMSEPGPSSDELHSILAAGHRVPDHGKIGPWRFVVFEGKAREDFGEVLVDAFLKANPEASDKLIAFEKARFTRAPVVVAIVSSPQEHKVPEWEQRLCAGAVCQNMLHAAKSLGFAAQWLTEWYAYDSNILKSLAVSDPEKIAGFIYIGSTNCKPNERVRPEIESRIQFWQR